jgi:hypothetical protein
VFNTENPLDVISLQMLIANKYVAPTKDAAYTADYKDSQYYAYTEDSEITEETTLLKKRDKAVKALFDISEDKERMLLYGQYLEGLKYTPSLKTDSLYKMLRTYIDDKDIKNAERFLDAVKQPIEKLQIKNIVDRAIKQRLITRSNAGKKAQVYQFGNVTLGTTLEEVYRNLALPDFASELISIEKSLETA